MSSDEENIAALYAQRQCLLKKLGEVNSAIRTLEHEMREKANQNTSRIPTNEVHAESIDADRGSLLIDSSVRDANGLRDAMRAVDAFKGLREGSSEDEVNTQKHLLRNNFVHRMISKAHYLMLDPNGSKLVQHALGLLKNRGSLAPSLFSTDYIVDLTDSNLSEILLLLTMLKEHIPEICCDTNGTCVMQNLLDCLKSLEELEFCAKCFSESIIKLSKDINGNHTVNRLLAAARPANFGDDNGEMDDAEKEKLSQIHQIIYKNFPENCIDVCKNRQGCCIIQKCLQWAPEPYSSLIIDTVLQNTLKLVHDPFGNYVIQFILDHERDLSQRFNQGQDATNYTNRIIRQMLHNVASLSCNKFSSNVIEKCLKTASPEVRQLLIDELTDPQVLPKLLTDSFANYVIQTAIVTSSEENQFLQLRDSIMPLQQLLKNSPYGAKVETKLARRQRETIRKQGAQKQQGRRGVNSSGVAEQALPDSLFGTQFFNNMPTIATPVRTDDLNQHTMAFPGVHEDVSPMMAQPGYMPFMLQGYQAFIDVQRGHPQQAVPVNMKDGGVLGPQQGFAVLHNPNQKWRERK